jgi:hypothetical protein
LAQLRQLTRQAIWLQAALAVRAARAAQQGLVVRAAQPLMAATLAVPQLRVLVALAVQAAMPEPLPAARERLNTAHHFREGIHGRDK